MQLLLNKVTLHRCDTLYPPVCRRGHFSPCRELKRVHHSQNLIEVASCGGGVQHWQFQPFVGADDKHLHKIGEKTFALYVDEGTHLEWGMLNSAYTASCEGQAVFVPLVWVQHAQGYCQLPVTVCYDGIGQGTAARLITVVRQDVLVSSESVISLKTLMFPPSTTESFNIDPLFTTTCLYSTLCVNIDVVAALYCVIPCSSRGDPPVSQWTGQSFWHCVYWTHWTAWHIDPAQWCTRGCSLWGGRTEYPIWNKIKI